MWMVVKISACAYSYPNTLQIWTYKEINRFQSTCLSTLYSLPQDSNKASTLMKFLKKIVFVSE